MSRKPKVDRDVLEEAYRKAAETAVAMERSGNYARAGELWGEAAKQAVTLKQREWCNTRKTYCKTWQGKREKRQ